jgi:hypothetical protein
MDAVKKFFDKVANAKDQYKCKVRVKCKQDDGEEVDKLCDHIVTVGKDSLWNIKRHLIRNHEDVMKQIEEAEKGID